MKGGTGKRKNYSDNSDNSNSDSNDNSISMANLMLRSHTNLHKTLLKRQSQSKRTRINARTKVFYRFRNLVNNFLMNTFEGLLNRNNVNFYIINYTSKDDLNIQCLTPEFKVTTVHAQSEPLAIENDNEDDEVTYEMIANEIYGNLNGRKKIIGNNIDFLNYVYFNENGTCFYLIKNPAFFNYMREADPEIRVSNEEINLGLSIR